MQCWWEYKLGAQHRDSLKIKKEELPYDLTILANFSKKRLIQKDMCTPMFFASLFTVVKIQRQPMCPLIDEWIKKMWYMSHKKE